MSGAIAVDAGRLYAARNTEYLGLQGSAEAAPITLLLQRLDDARREGLSANTRQCDGWREGLIAALAAGIVAGLAVINSGGTRRPSNGSPPSPDATLPTGRRFGQADRRAHLALQAVDSIRTARHQPMATAGSFASASRRAGIFVLAMRSRSHISLLACAVLLASAGCRSGKPELPVSSGTIAAPYQEFDQATLCSFEGSHRKWRLESLYMRKPLGDTGTVLAVPVVLALFDSTGKTTTKILSDSGLTTPAMESFLIWGDVYVRTRENLVVRTERIALDAKTRMWHSDTFVEIRSAKGDVLRGKGFDATENFSRSTFRKSVSGQFPKFRERMEQDEGFF